MVTANGKGIIADGKAIIATGDHGSWRRGSGGDQIDRRGGGDVSGHKGGGDVSDSRGGLRKHEEGGIGTRSKRNSGRNGEASVSIIAIDRVPDGDVPSTSGRDDGERRNSAFKGQCSKCYEEGRRRKDCPYKVTYRVLTLSEAELARTEKLPGQQS
ncbi:CCHC-type domain-containing protein [Aphis craccivora]|uniref:CCHC-type domain-containing protein n=1 Tax=Aphis craccivora TaxID=307492 RepID=A0A6G0VP43_APHCR|nr:CCHC-type domain-containing protein [Aphis craccivora]